MTKKLTLALAIISFTLTFKLVFDTIEFAEKVVSDAEESYDSWTYPEAEFRSTSQKLSELRRTCNGNGCLDSDDIYRLAFEMHSFSKTFGFSPQKLTQILMVENPWLDSTAVSPAGAIGLMQVMPFHAGAWSGCGQNLTSVSDNLCHSVSILEAYTLLRYNGCTKVYCMTYVQKVQDATE